LRHVQKVNHSSTRRLYRKRIPNSKSCRFLESRIFTTHPEDFDHAELMVPRTLDSNVEMKADRRKRLLSSEIFLPIEPS
jgi:hypothetical protein